jgi:hypothetical protein
MTNRDLYLFVAGLTERKADSERTLEGYLRCFLRLAGEERGAAGLDGAAFAALLERSFDDPVPADAEPAPSGGADPSGGAGPSGGAPGFGELARVLERQIRDLREMDQAGTLRDEMRYFGKDAPSGSRWYNFDPCTFIECATAGTFRGWREDARTSREYVPGEVAVPTRGRLDRGGRPAQHRDPVRELGLLGWDGSFASSRWASSTSDP